MFASLRHRTIGSRNNQNRAIHLRGAGNHILDIVGVTRTIDMSVMPLLGFVFQVGDVDRYAALLFFGSRVDLVNGFFLGLQTFQTQGMQNSRAQRGFTVVNVTNGSDI